MITCTFFSSFISLDMHYFIRLTYNTSSVTQLWTEFEWVLTFTPFDWDLNFKIKEFGLWTLDLSFFIRREFNRPIRCDLELVRLKLSYWFYPLLHHEFTPSEISHILRDILEYHNSWKTLYTNLKTQIILAPALSPE